jgi:hypothetical protein
MNDDDDNDSYDLDEEIRRAAKPPPPDIKCTRCPNKFPPAHYEEKNGERIGSCRRCTIKHRERAKLDRKRKREEGMRPLQVGATSTTVEGAGSRHVIGQTSNWKDWLATLALCSKTRTPQEYQIKLGVYDNISEIIDKMELAKAISLELWAVMKYRWV